MLGLPNTQTADEIPPQLGVMNREGLIELGVALTGDAGRAEVAFDRAFALV